MSVTVIPAITIHPDRLILTNKIEYDKPRVKFSNRHDIRKESNENKGKLSENSKRKINRAISYLLHQSKVKEHYNFHNDKSIIFKVSFITLTLSSAQIHTDSEITQQLLHHFLVTITAKFGVKKYVWRAEKQKNQNIHYHILTDVFIPAMELREIWNNIQNKLGYVDSYRKQMKLFHRAGFKLRMELIAKWSPKDQYKAYLKGKAQNWSQPNSTDIHSIRMVGNLQAYVTKYMAKHDQEGNETARIWGSSRNLSNLKGASELIDSGIADEISMIKKYFKPFIIRDTYFEIIFIDINLFRSIDCHYIPDLFKEYLKIHFDG